MKRNLTLMLCIVVLFVTGCSESLVTKPESIESSSTTMPSGRDLEAYCGEGGGEKLQGDLSDALNATVYSVMQELGLRQE